MIIMIDVSIVLKGADRLVSNRKLNLLWQLKPRRLSITTNMNSPKAISAM